MSVEDREALERRILADPGDEAARAALLQLRARVEGQSVFLEALKDRRKWIALPQAIQDLAFEEVGRRLGEAFDFLGAQVYACGGAEHRIGVFRHRLGGISMSLLPAGAYAERARRLAKGLRAKARLAKVQAPFLIAQTPLSRGQWGRLMDAEISEENARYPMTHISWGDAVDAAEAGGLRLAWESEWEYAARAGTDSRFFWGDELDERYLWFYDNARGTLEGEMLRVDIGAHRDQANAFGLSDPLGCVWEWCEDLWDDHGEEGPRPGDTGEYRLHEPEERVIRGGCWILTAAFCRSDSRFRSGDENASEILGARFACSIPKRA